VFSFPPPIISTTAIQNLIFEDEDEHEDEYEVCRHFSGFVLVVVLVLVLVTNPQLLPANSCMKVSLRKTTNQILINRLAPF
jgi:hypothetical protein